MAYSNPLGSSNAGYIQNYAGLFVPSNKSYKESNSPGRQVQDTDWVNYQDLNSYIRWQLTQSRRKYFIFHEMYRRDTWIRASIDYIVRRITRDANRLVDDLDPLNPDIDDLQDFLDDCFPDGDFEDLYGGVTQDLLEYQQGYLYIEKTRGGVPLALWPLDSRITFPITDQHGSIIFHAQVYNGQVTYLEKDEVIYFNQRNNGSDPKGVPAMETLIDSVAMELNANAYNAALFENGLNIGAIFSIPNATEEDVTENLRFLEDYHTRPANAHRTLILRGEVKMLRDGALLTKDLNFELLIRLARHRVTAVFGVPESLLGITDAVNRSEGQVQERNTYVNTIRPLRKRVNRQFTKQFVRDIWGSKSVRLDEPINSMLPTSEEIDAVSKVAEIGATYNDIREMLGWSRVPWADYFVMKNPANGGMVRLDTIMPGLGDPHFDIVAYQLMHEQQTQQASDMAAQGIVAPTSETPYAPPAPQDMIQMESVAARIIDVSRSLPSEVSRRNPLAPGARGGNVYFTKSGKPRYGAPPKGQQAPLDSKDGTPNNNTLTNPHDPNVAKTITPEDRIKIQAAKAQVEEIFRKSQLENWTNEQFISQLEQQGWQKAVGSLDVFQDAKGARGEARRLADINPDKVYTLLGSDGSFFIMENELSVFDQAGQEKGVTDKTSDPSLKRSLNPDYEHLDTLRRFLRGQHD